MPSESSTNARSGATGAVEPPPSSRSYHNGSSHHASHKQSVAPTPVGDEMMGLQADHRGSSRRHHSHHHRHHHRSRHGDASSHSPSTRKADENTNGTATHALPAEEKPSDTAHDAAMESSRASTRSSRLPARRSERNSVVGAGSTFGNSSIHKADRAKDSSAVEPASRKEAASAASTSSANVPSTTALSAMRTRDKAVTATTATAKKSAAASATHSASFSSSTYSSQEGGINFHTATQQDEQQRTATSMTDAAAAGQQTRPSHSATSINFFTASRQSTTHPTGEVSATTPPPPPASEPSKRSSHRSPPPSQKQPTDAASKRSYKEGSSAATPSNGHAASHSRQSEGVEKASAAAPPSASSPAPAGAAPESPSSSSTAAAAALAALKTAPKSDVLVRSWQADVAPDAQNPPSSVPSSVRRGHIGEAAEDGRHRQSSRHHRHHHRRSTSSRKHGPLAADREESVVDNVPASASRHRHHRRSESSRKHINSPAATATSAHAPEKVSGGGDGGAAAQCEATPSSLHRDSRSSSHYDKTAYPPAPALAPAAISASVDAPASVTSGESPAAPPTENRPATASNGRSPQRERTSSVNRRPSTAFEPFQLKTDRRSVVRRTSSPQAYVARDPLRELPKEEQGRLMGLPHETFNAPGTWRLDMRYEEDRKEYFKQTHLVDPMTRTRPGMRQFHIPEQADLFGMYPDIPMTKDEEGNDIVEHLAPVPIQGESFVKARKSYAPPRPSQQQQQQQQQQLRKPLAENEEKEDLRPSAASQPSAADVSSGAARRGSRGLAGLVWGYGEEASKRPGGLTPPRGRFVSDVTAPYRRNPAMSTGQIGCHGGDGTLNIFRMSPASEDNSEFAQQPQRQQQTSGLVGTPPRSSRGLARDVSPASTMFAIMQPSPSPSFPTTTNSDYGLSQQLYADATILTPPHQPPAPSDDGERSPLEERGRDETFEEGKGEATHQQQQQQQQHRPRGIPSEAVVLQPSVGGVSSKSRSPSEGVLRASSTTPPIADAASAGPMSIQTNEDAASIVTEKDATAHRSKPVGAAESKTNAAADEGFSDRSSRTKERGAKESSSRPRTRDTHTRREEDTDKTAGVQPPRSSAATERSSEPSEAKAPSSAVAGSGKQAEAATSKPITASERRSTRSTPAASLASSAASVSAVKPAAGAAAAPVVTPLAKVEGITTAASSELYTPTSAKPDSTFPVPSPAPERSSLRAWRARAERPASATAEKNEGEAQADAKEISKERRRQEKPSRASSSADVPPPLPPPPSTQRSAATATQRAAEGAFIATATAPSASEAPAASSTRTHETSICTTDDRSVHEAHYDPTVTSEAGVAAAASTAPSHRSAGAPSKSGTASAAISAASSRRAERKPADAEERSVTGGKRRQHRCADMPAASPASSTAASSSSAVKAVKERRTAGDAVPRSNAVASDAKDTPSASSSSSSSSSSYHSRHCHSVNSQVSAVSSFAPASKAPSTAPSSAFSGRQYAYTSEPNTPAASVKNGETNESDSRRGSNVGGFRKVPVVSESGTQTDFVFVLDPLQGRQFVQREQEQQEFLEYQQQQQQRNVLHILDTRRSSSGIFTNLSSPRQSQTHVQALTSLNRSVSPSEQRAAGVSSGVSPTRSRRTGYANTSTNVRDLLRWN